MKQEFSTNWSASKQPRKQRKYLANMPAHTRHKLLSSHLSKELRTRFKRRSFPVRKGDTVKVMKGEFFGKTGKISMINLKRSRVAIEGLQNQKKDGTKVNVSFRPSNLMITELILEDKERDKAIRRNTIKEEKKK